MEPSAFPLSRLCYAPFPEDAQYYAAAGLNLWLDQQLKPSAIPDAECEERLRNFTLQIKYPAGNGQPAPNGEIKNWPAVDEMRPLQYVGAPVETAWALLDPKTQRANEEHVRPYFEVCTATVMRAMHSRRQLFEQMVAFWHDHFNVAASEDRRVGATFPTYDRDTIRPHALGNFRELLEAVAASPAMLIYLSNWTSRAGAANENYARELMELHTLGRDAYLNDRYDRWRDVPGASEGKPAGYIDEDVYEAARAFTGWSVENGQRLDATTELPHTGKFVYVESWHDGYQKRVLATEFPSFAKPMADGRKVLDLVAAHPATARFICQKLCRRLISDNPPAPIVESAAKVWMENAKKPDQIAAVVRHIVLSKEFEASKGAKVRSPLALAATFARATGIDFVATIPFINHLAACGQRLFGWPAPNGRPDTADYYMTPEFLRERWVLLTRLAQNAWSNGRPKVLDAAKDGAPAAAIAEEALVRFESPAASAPAILAALNMAPADPLKDEKRVAQLLSLCAAVPQLQTT
jgi:uncharacterized protein (DUF1800 family)